MSKSQMQNIRPGIDSTAEPNSSEKNSRMSRSRGIVSRKPDVSRQQNLIFFGLSEKHFLIESKCIVDEMFDFLVNKPVVIKDLVRIRITLLFSDAALSSMSSSLSRMVATPFGGLYIFPTRNNFLLSLSSTHTISRDSSSRSILLLLLQSSGTYNRTPPPLLVL